MRPVMEHIQSMEGKLPWVKWKVADAFLDAFGSKTIKHVRLHINKRWVYELARGRPDFRAFDRSDTTTHKTITTEIGTKKTLVNGGPGSKVAQEYPDECGT